jgi:hypothetical protein
VALGYTRPGVLCPGYRDDDRVREVKIDIEVFWCLTPSSVVSLYETFGKTYYCHVQLKPLSGSSIFSRNIDIHVLGTIIRSAVLGAT